LGEQRVSDQPFLVVLYFYGQQLESIDLGYSGAELGSSWEDWSEEREMKRKERHDDWLRMQTEDVSRVYDWGEVLSDYDERSGGSSITIRYSWQGKPWPRHGAT
jgi:hypothetical protein